jgi:NADPH:quinone reductase-like Zn-dependent oxidoreductase
MMGLDLPRLAVVRLRLKPQPFDGEANAGLQAEGTWEMRAVICTRYGPPEVLRLEELETPTPQKNEVRIRIFATAVTSSDCYLRGLSLTFAYRIMARLALGWTAPRRNVLGMVLSGEVDAVGPDVRSFKAGDQVFGFDRHLFGTYAEYVCWPEDGLLATRPANLTDEEAASIPYGGLLALHFLRRASVQTGQRVLVYGASGAVGTSAVQLARHLGAEVTGVCSTANLELVQSLGATTVVDYTREDFSDRGERYDLIFDAVGKRKSAAGLRQCDQAVASGGKRLSVDDGTPKLLAEDLMLLGELAGKGEIRPVIDRCYPLEELAEAHRYVDEGHKRGNVVITVAQGG